MSLNSNANKLNEISTGRIRPRKQAKEIVKLASTKKNKKSDKSDLEECKEVEKTCDVTLDMTTSRDGSVTIIVKGAAENVKDARRELVMRLGNVEKTDVLVPRKYAGFVIGNGGRNIKDISESTNTKISVNNQDSDSTVFSIRGEPRDMQRARHMIQSVVSGQRDRISKNVDIPPNVRGFICGALDCEIEYWKAEYGVHIKVFDDSLTVSGGNDDVLSLCKDIEEKCNHWTSSCHKFEFPVESRRLTQMTSDRRALNTLFIDILQTTNVSTCLGNGCMVLTGKLKTLGQALTILLTEINSHVFHDLKVPTWMHRHLKRHISVHYTFYDDLITLDGPPDMVEDVVSDLNKIIEKMSIELTHVAVTINRKHHSRLIGRKGAMVKDVSRRFNVDMRFPAEYHKDLDVVYLEGNPKDVEACKQHILMMVDDIENESNAEIMVPRYLHEPLRESDKLNDIVNNLSVAVTFGEGDNISLRGRSSAINECRIELKQITDSLARIYSQQMFHDSPSFISALNATKWRPIGAICDRTGASIRHFEGEFVVTGKNEYVEKAMEQLRAMREYHDSGETIPVKQAIWEALMRNGAVKDLEIKFKVEMEMDGGDCIIKGQSSSTGACKRELTVLLKKEEYSYAEYTSPLLTSSFYRERIEKIAEESGVWVSHPAVVGKNAKGVVDKIQQLARGGCKCKRIELEDKFWQQMFSKRRVLKDRVENETRVSLVTKERKHGKTEVEIFAETDDDISAAVKYIDSIIADLGNIKQITVPLERQHVGHVIGVSGSNIRDLEDCFAVKIELFDKEENPKLRISGSEGDCEAVKDKILGSLPVVQTIDVDLAVRSRLIGTKGSRVAQICDQYNVGIKFQTGTGIVEVKGSPEDVEHAIVHIRERANEILKVIEDREASSYTRSVRVKKAHVGRIIGRKGVRIDNLRKKYAVNVSVDDDGESEYSQLVLMGKQEGVDKAFESLAKLVEDMEAEVAVSIHVPVSVHPILIGRSGKRIKEMMSKYNVLISFSKSVETLVEIVGKAENANECADYIETIVEEHVEFPPVSSTATSLADYL